VAEQKPTRRTVLKAASMAVAAAGVATAAPDALAGSASAERGPSRSFVVHVDHRTGELTVMSGEREFRHRDRDLADRLARLADA